MTSADGQDGGHVPEAPKEPRTGAPLLHPGGSEGAEDRRRCFIPEAPKEPRTGASLLHPGGSEEPRTGAPWGFQGWDLVAWLDGRQIWN